LQNFKDDFQRRIVKISRKGQCRVSRNIIETHEAYLKLKAGNSRLSCEASEQCCCRTFHL